MGIVMAVAATLGATFLTPTYMLMGFFNKFMEFPSAETDGPPNNMELEVACPPSPVKGNPSIARTRDNKLGSPNLA